MCIYITSIYIYIYIIHTHTHTHTQPLRRCRQHAISTRPASMRMMCPVAQAPLAANTPAKVRAGTRDTSVTISNT